MLHRFAETSVLKADNSALSPHSVTVSFLNSELLQFPVNVRKRKLLVKTGEKVQIYQQKHDVRERKK